MSKRVKINFNNINKDNWTPIDMKEVYRQAKETHDQEVLVYKEKLEKEQQRIEGIACPCCKSKDKKHILSYENNGIIGPGSRAWPKEDYYICNGCGIHFSDLNKVEIKPPNKGLFNF